MFRLTFLLLALGTTQGDILWDGVCMPPSPTASMPFCNKKLPHEQRVQDYLSRIPIAQKLQMMQNGAAAVKDLDIPMYQWGSEGLHGPLQPCVGGVCPSSFPAASATAASFNQTLFHLIGNAIGVEARAINNLRNHKTMNVYGDGIDYWSPTINMQRDPRWGRNQEVPGEDPHLTGTYAMNYIKGLQNGADNRYIQIIATCKHFVANSLENWFGHTRHNFDAWISMKDLSDYYLPAFKMCVQDGGALGIMCSYNAVRGVPSCANKWLLKSVLRDTWGFPGYVTSDCGAVANIYQKQPQGHGYAPNGTIGSADALQAGTDTNCGGAYGQHLESAYDAGYVTQELTDESMTRLTTLQMDLGLFDNDKAKTQPYFTYGADKVDTQAHRQLALEAAQQAMVLLQNPVQSDGSHILPISPGKTIAVVGPHFNATEAFLSNYHGARCLDGGWDCIETPLDAITKANTGGKTQGTMGCAVSGGKDNTDQAVQLAKASDIVVLMMGIDQTQEREGHDRVNTTLPGFQEELVTKVLALNKPTIMVLVNGGALAIDFVLPATPIKNLAIIEGFYAGEMAAFGITDVIFGKYNPSGKLPATMYPHKFISQLPLTQMNMTVYPGRTYIYYQETPLFPFGFGLSYTTFQLQWTPSPPPTTTTVHTSQLESIKDKSKAPLATYTVKVTNTGKMYGKETVLAFMKPKNVRTAAAPVQMNKKLFGYEGANLNPGQSATFSFALTARHLTVSNKFGDQMLHPGTYDIIFSRGHGEELLAEIDIVGATVEVEHMPRE